MPLASRSLHKVLFVALFAGILIVALAGRAEGETTLASWYGPGFEGLPTASGEPYDPYGYTAAHKTLPFGTKLLVSYEGASVGVTVNDRGPYVGARELDLSQGAADVLGLTRAGVDRVEYSYSGAPADQYASEQQYDQTPAPVSDQYAYAEAATEQYGSSSGTEGPAYGGYADTVDQTLRAGSDFETTSQGAAVSYQNDGLYVVQSGDTLSGISLELGVSVETLASSNGVADPDVIYAGQVLFY